jgi:hypothetical protein
MATKTLLIDESEFIDFQLYGLASAYSDSPQFIYHFNSFFATRFERCADLDVLTNKKISYYPVFEWKNPENRNHYHIIKNVAYALNNPGEIANLASLFEISPYLVSQFKEYNYLLKISGDENEEIPFYENPFIQKITRLEPKQIKAINRLIF